MPVPRTPLRLAARRREAADTGRGVPAAARRWAATRRWVLPAEALTPERGNGPPTRNTLAALAFAIRLGVWAEMWYNAAVIQVVQSVRCSTIC